ncbi:MAG TPA: substrate-binding domain-containing protein [Actinomycetota bacterium]
MGSRKVVAVAVVAAIGLSAGLVHAEPTVGSPLVGEYCSAGSSISGTGASFAKNAHNNVFIPAYDGDCGEGAVSYSSTGSGAGKLATRNRTHAFGGSDEPLDATEVAIDSGDTGDPNAPNPGGRVSPLHHIPIALGAVTVSYNLAICGITGQEAISLRSPMIAGIFSGAITKWNDPLLTLENPNLANCNRSITLVVRADGSGTTYAFKDYLSKRNPLFQAYKSNDFNTAWPAEDLGLNTPVRGPGNGGVADGVKNNDASIGYVELSTAKSKGLKWALVDGATGVFNAPDDGRSANCELAATGATHPPSTLSPGWDAVSITDTPNPLAYAICTFTYALVYNDLATAFGGAMSRAQAQTLVDYMNRALEPDVQDALADHGYAPLPASLQAVAQAGMASVAYV